MHHNLSLSQKQASPFQKKAIFLPPTATSPFTKFAKGACMFWNHPVRPRCLCGDFAICRTYSPKRVFPTRKKQSRLFSPLTPILPSQRLQEHSKKLQISWRFTKMRNAPFRFQIWMHSTRTLFSISFIFLLLQDNTHPFSLPLPRIRQACQHRARQAC